MRHLIDFADYSSEELKDMIETALLVKKDPGRFASALRQKTLLMVFQKTSTRTRVSFETGMNKLGGHAVFLDWRTTNFVLADIKDEVRYLSGNVDLIMARMLFNADLREMAAYASVPVINGCCNMYHPCQALADFLTLCEALGSVKDRKLVYVGVLNNVANSLIDLGTKLGCHVVAVCPVVNEPSVDLQLLDRAEKTGLFGRSLDLAAELKDADAVYTDSWVDMEFFTNPKFEKQKNERIETMLPYQLNRENLKGSKAIIMHDMPMHTGYEIDRETIEHPNSVIFEQSWNRMHAQNAAILKLMGAF